MNRTTFVIEEKYKQSRLHTFILPYFKEAIKMQLTLLMKVYKQSGPSSWRLASVSLVLIFLSD